MAGIPRMAGGKAVVGQFDNMIAAAIAKYKQLNKRAPSAQEVEQLKSHVQGLSSPTSPILRTNKDTQARAAYELGTDLNLINPDTARDEFLTKMTTGRTTKGTNLRPIAQDVSDPSVIKNIEAQQMGGQLDEMIPGVSQSSTTPSADYFANTARGIENEAISGKSLDDLKQVFNDFVAKNGRQPEQDELSAIIADYNVVRHQYGPKGASVVNERPGTAKGMEAYRTEARANAIPEAYLTKRPGNYPQYLQDELTLAKGELPTTTMKEVKKKRASGIEPTDFYIDEEGNLVKVFPTMKAEGGQITPEEMRHMMIVNGQTPEKFAGGGRPGVQELDEWAASQKDPYNFAPKFQAYEPGVRERATDAIAPYLEKIGMAPRRAYEQSSNITGFVGGMDPKSLNAKTGIGPTMFIDPLAPFEAAEEFKRGDVLSGLLSASILPGQAMAIKPIKRMGSNKIKKSK